MIKAHGSRAGKIIYMEGEGRERGTLGGEGSNGLGGDERGIKRTKHAGAIVTRRKRESGEERGRRRVEGDQLLNRPVIKTRPAWLHNTANVLMVAALTLLDFLISFHECGGKARITSDAT